MEENRNVTKSGTMEQKNDSELDFLFKLLSYLKTKLKFVIVGTLLGALIGFLTASLLIVPKYTSFIDLYVTNNTNTENDTVNVNDITAAQKLVNTYMVMLQANTVTTKVLDEIDDRLTRDQLLGSVSFSAVQQTEVLRITAETADPQLSYDICNAYKDIASGVLEDIVGAGSVKVISTPEFPKGPSSPNVFKFTGVGAMIGLAIVVAIVSLLMMMDTTVEDEKSLSSRYAIPVLGAVPDFFRFSKTLGISKRDVKRSAKLKAKNLNNEKIVTSATVLNDDTPFPIAEAYNSIRSNVLFSLPSLKNASGVIVVTSPNANDLKTTTSINLAISLGQSGAKVLLIDADLRNPSIYRHFKASNTHGLSRVLAGYDEFRQAVIRTESGIDLLSAGPTPPRPAEMLSSGLMTEFLKEVSAVYDFVVVDTSPVNLVSDALVMATGASGIILAVRENKTSFNELDRAIKTIEMSKAEIIGFVLTDVDMKGGSYGYHRYGYGYGYGYGSTKKS